MSESPSDVFVLGDNQYNSGLFSEYTGPGAYGATWGAFNPIVHPVPGNHEYTASSSAAGYFQYFGQSVANPQSTPGGYYSFNLGSWHIVALNSNCSDSACADSAAGTTTSAQTSWLQADLAANHSACVLAMWHHPLFSSGFAGDSPGVAPLWSALYAAHADVVLNGHDHVYERYAQQDPSAAATTSGIREFVVGTGGENLFSITNREPNLQASDASDFGVLVLTLHATSYDWKFVATNGTVIDTGTTACHGSGAAAASPLAAHIARARSARLFEPRLAFDARPQRVSLSALRRRGLPVAIYCSRACDVTISVSLRRGRRARRIATYYETESEIPKPHSRVVLPLPQLRGVRYAELLLRFAALDAAGHHRVLTRTVTLK